MEDMFYGAAKYDQEMIWDTSRVTNMKGMFARL